VKDFILFILSIIFLAAFSFASYFVFSGQIKTTDQNMLLLIGSAYGAIVSQAGNVITFWFGSSKGSADKDATISTIATQKGV
jgi:flagellar basal body-associated protein FliL